MRLKSHILDRSEKVLLKFPEYSPVKAEHDHLFLEVLLDIRDRLTLINSALQALNKQMATRVPGPPKT